MSKTCKLVMRIEVRQWLKWVALPFVLVGIPIPNCILRTCMKVTGPHYENKTLRILRAVSGDVSPWMLYRGQIWKVK